MNGIQRKEKGTLVSYTNATGSTWDMMVKHGAFTFISPEGMRTVVHYRADQNGYVETSRTETSTEAGERQVDGTDQWDELFDQALFEIPQEYISKLPDCDSSNECDGRK